MKLLKEKTFYIPISVFIFCLLHFLSVTVVDVDGNKGESIRERLERIKAVVEKIRVKQTAIHKYLLYATNFAFYRRDLDEHETSINNDSIRSSNDGESMTQRPANDPKGMLTFHFLNHVAADHLSGIEYSPKTRKFYYADCLRFDEIDMSSYKETKFQETEDIRHCYGQLAYVSSDTGDRMFYISYRVPRPMSGAGIEYELYSQDMVKREESPKKIRAFTDRPLAFVAYPKNGSLLLATLDAITKKSEVRKLDYDGVELAKLDIDDDLRSLAIDYAEDRLYWITSTDMVRSSKLDGTDIWTMTRTLPTINTNNIIVDGSWIYAKNGTSIWRVQKTGGEEEAIIPHDRSTKLYSEMKIYDMQAGL